MPDDHKNPPLAPPNRERRSIEVLLQDKRVKEGLADVATTYMSPDRMLRLSVNAIRKTPKLLLCDPQSVLGALMTAASLGLEPNSVLGHCYLIPYEVSRRDKNGDWVKQHECNFQIGYKGFVELAYRSPLLVRLKAEAIYEGDDFEYLEGSETFLRYRKTLGDPGDLRGSFCYMLVKRGDVEAEVATVLRLRDVVNIRSRSETYRALKARVENASNAKDRAYAERTFAETPWVMWEDQMAAKSAIKRAASQFSLSPQMASASAIDSRGDSGQLDLSAMNNPDVALAVREGIDPPLIEGEAESVDEEPKERPAAPAARRSKPEVRTQPKAEKPTANDPPAKQQSTTTAPEEREPETEPPAETEQPEPETDVPIEPPPQQQPTGPKPKRTPMDEAPEMDL